MQHISADNQAIYWVKDPHCKALQRGKKIKSKLKTSNIVSTVEFEIATDIRNRKILVARVNCPYKPSSSSLPNLGPSTNNKVVNTVSFNTHC
jgi:hypothetical protein